MACMTAPATESPIPTAMTETVRGRREFMMMFSSMFRGLPKLETRLKKDDMEVSKLIRYAPMLNEMKKSRVSEMLPAITMSNSLDLARSTTEPFK